MMGVTVFAGRFGSGKTEAAINYALALRGRGSCPTEASSLPDTPGSSPTNSHVLLVDLDVVTPYFRSRETAEAMRPEGVQVIAPSIVGQHLDMPAITPQIRGAIEQTACPTVIDVGGDRQGARALGSFRAAIERRGYRMHFVVNPYRPFTDTAAGLAVSIAEIEASCRLRVTDLVSNPNMMYETTEQDIVTGHALVEAFAREIGLPIAFVCVENRHLASLTPEAFGQPVLAMERFFVQPWEDRGVENASGASSAPRQ